jgi:catechol 2,3-dioxygenase-like lactoylglutathione lyase family enzyme
VRWVPPSKSSSPNARSNHSMDLVYWVSDILINMCAHQESKMTSSTQPQQDSTFRLDQGMRLGPPTLRVRNLEETARFYEKDIGLHVDKRRRDSEGLEVLELGFKQNTGPLLILKHDAGAGVPPVDSAGLYHYAVLLPDRKGLASPSWRLEAQGSPTRDSPTIPSAKRSTCMTSR